MKSLFECLRTLLILGRVSNLPTVWSNLMAGWIVTYVDVNPSALTLVLLAGTFLYTGGMYLNDFCDAPFDAQYCPQRPIPSGKISRRLVGGLAVLWFAAGISCLAPFGLPVVEAGLLLVAAIVIYDFHHKNVSWAPLTMGFCRFLLYLLAASVAANPYPLWALPPFGINPGLYWHLLPDSVALALYVAGITYLARGESRPTTPTRWALFLLLFPVLVSFGFCVLPPHHHAPTLLFCLLLLGWMAWLLIPLWRKTNRSIGRVVSGLLAGIVLVDAIAVAPMLEFQSAWLLLLFALALLLQRVIPAT